MRTLRRWAGFAVVGAAALPVSACSVQWACPAIGYIPSVVVTLEGAVDRVDLVELCAGGICSNSLELRTDAPMELVETLPPDTPSPAVSKPAAVSYASTRVDATTWNIAVIAGPAPERAILRAYAGDHSVLVELRIALEWTRVGGSEQCGGHTQAGPIALNVP